MQIQTDVLEVLSTVRLDCNLAHITQGQLDRKLYQRVDKVLQALGGKWDRRQRAHVFPTGPKHRIDAAIMTGSVEVPADVGYFPTPDKIADKVVSIAAIRDGNRVLEPSAGRGALFEAIVRAGSQTDVTLVERDEQRAAYLRGLVAHGENPRMRVYEGDFLAVSRKFEHDFDRVVMNPPFCKVGLGDHLDHVQRAHELIVPGRDARLVAILPSSITFRQDRRHTEFRDWYQELDGEFEELPAGSFKISGTSVNAVILTMGKS